MALFWKRKYIWDIILAIVIIVLPFLLYIHVYIEESELTYFMILDYKYEHGARGVKYFIYYVSTKLIPISVLGIWFLTSSNWWRYFILIPILFLLYGLTKIVYPTDFDKNHHIYFSVFCICFFLVCFLFFDFFVFKAYRKTKLMVAPIRIFKNEKERYHQIHKKFGPNAMASHKKVSEKSYFKQLYTGKIYMQKELKILFTSTEVKKFNWKIDAISVFLLVSTSFILHFHRIIPDGIEVYHTKWFTITSHGFNDISYYWYYMGMKLAFLIPLCVWFVTSRYWWRFAIFSPIILCTYQVWALYQNTSEQLDEYEYIKAFPTTCLLILFLLLLSHVVKYESRILDIYDGITKEIEVLIRKTANTNTDLSTIKNDFNSIKQQHITEETAKTHLKELQKIKEKLEQQLKDCN